MRVSGLSAACYRVGMENRADRVEAITSHLLDNPQSQITGAEVADYYKREGIAVSTRQARRDLEEARRRVTIQSHQGPALPDWCEPPALDGGLIRSTIHQALTNDRHATLPQIASAVAAAHGRSISDAHLLPMARTIWQRIYIDPQVAKARTELAAPTSTGQDLDMLSRADPINWINPFGTDTKLIRLRALTWYTRAANSLGSKKTILRADVNLLLRTAKAMAELADAIDASQGDNQPAVTVKRTQTESLQYRD